MEEKYNFEKKKNIINNLIKKKLNKSCIVKKYENLQITKNTKFCLYCEREIKNDLYCSLICKEIFENNLINLNNYENISFPSFEMLTNSSKEKFKKFLDNIKENKIKYDKVIILYEYKKASKDINVFKKITSKFILIINYEKIFYEILDFDIIIFKTNIKNINEPNNFELLPQDIKNELSNKCLYCKEEVIKKTFFFLPKNHILGLFCSNFCLNVFVSTNEEHIKQPYKMFFMFPHYYYFESKTLIENLKNFFNNKKNLKKLITYNVNYTSKKNFEIIEIIY